MSTDQHRRIASTHDNAVRPDAAGESCPGAHVGFGGVVTHPGTGEPANVPPTGDLSRRIGDDLEDDVSDTDRPPAPSGNLPLQLWGCGEATECAIPPVLDEAHAALDRRDWTGAAQRYLDVLAGAPGNLEARAGLGTCLLAAGDTPQGLGELGVGARLAAAPDILTELASALAHAGRPDDAQRLLQRLLVLAPSHVGIRAALDRLRALPGSVKTPASPPVPRAAGRGAP